MLYRLFMYTSYLTLSQDHGESDDALNKLLHCNFHKHVILTVPTMLHFTLHCNFHKHVILTVPTMLHFRAD